MALVPKGAVLVSKSVDLLFLVLDFGLVYNRVCLAVRTSIDNKSVVIWQMCNCDK